MTASEQAPAGAPGRSLGPVTGLVVTALYALALLSWDILNFEQQVDVPLIVLGVALWLVLLVRYVRAMVSAADRRSAFWENLYYPLLLLAPLLILPDPPGFLIFTVLIAYILQLRTVTAGRAFAFSFALVVFVALLTSAAMVSVEADYPESTLRDWPTALTWSLVSLLRVGDWAVGRPVSEDGRLLAIVVGICAVLAASLFTAQVIRWVTGVDRDQAQDDARPLTEPADVAAELARLREAVDALTERLDAAEKDGDQQQT